MQQCHTYKNSLFIYPYDKFFTIELLKKIILLYAMTYLQQ